jgi:predicted NBD/HSP70 family sugar kinase
MAGIIFGLSAPGAMPDCVETVAFSPGGRSTMSGSADDPTNPGLFLNENISKQGHDMYLRIIDIGGSGVKNALFIYENGQLSSCDISYFQYPDWEHFETWLSTKVPQDCGLIGVSCAGFVDSSNGVVKLFRAGGWVDRKLKDRIERYIGGSKVFIMNDGEAHLYAHNDLYTHPQICISLGSAVGFAVSDASGSVCRPSDNINYDLGEVMLPTRASNNRVWWALGSHGLNELQQNLGEQDGVIHFGYRLGAFLRNICSIFRPRTVVLSGGIAENYWHLIEIPLKNEFAHDKPDWLSSPQFALSPFGINAALWGVAKYVVTYV